MAVMAVMTVMTGTVMTGTVMAVRARTVMRECETARGRLRQSDQAAIQTSQNPGATRTVEVIGPGACRITNRLSVAPRPHHVPVRQETQESRGSQGSEMRRETAIHMNA
jgi:hypothetical protein